MDKYFAVFISEAQLPREAAIALMYRAQQSIGGEGELKATRAEEGQYCILFEVEGHRDAFLVSLRRRRVNCTPTEIDASQVEEPAPKVKSAPHRNSNPVSIGDALLQATEALIRELRKK